MPGTAERIPPDGERTRPDGERTRPDGERTRPDGERAPVLVLGVGNELFGDEGLGCVAASRVAELRLDGVEALDGSTLGIALLPEIADREALLLLDAIVSDGAAPGSIMELHGAQIPASRQLTISAHQIGVAEALSAASLADRAPRLCAAVGIVPVHLGTGYGLSPIVAARMDDLVARALDILAGWGVAVPARPVG